MKKITWSPSRASKANNPPGRGQNNSSPDTTECHTPVHHIKTGTKMTSAIAKMLGKDEWPQLMIE